MPLMGSPQDHNSYKNNVLRFSLLFCVFLINATSNFITKEARLLVDQKTGNAVTENIDIREANDKVQPVCRKISDDSTTTGSTCTPTIPSVMHAKEESFKISEQRQTEKGESRKTDTIPDVKSNINRRPLHKIQSSSNLDWGRNPAVRSGVVEPYGYQNVAYPMGTMGSNHPQTSFNTQLVPLQSISLLPHPQPIGWIPVYGNIPQPQPYVFYPGTSFDSAAVLYVKIWIFSFGALLHVRFANKPLPTGAGSTSTSLTSLNQGSYTSNQYHM